jgi:hypothetical protein
MKRDLALLLDGGLWLDGVDRPQQVPELLAVAIDRHEDVDHLIGFGLL